MSFFNETLEVIMNRVEELEVANSTVPTEENSTPFRTPGIIPPQNYASPHVGPINIRRLSNTGGAVDQLHRAMADTTNEVDNNNNSVANEARTCGRDLISNINLLWFYANMPATGRDSQSVMISSTESFFLGRIETLKSYRISKCDILHVATRIVKIMDLLAIVRGVESIPAIGFIDSYVRGLVITKFMAVHHLSADKERQIILQFENATELVKSQPTEWGLGAMIFFVIKCIAGMKNNSSFIAVLEKLTMWVPSVHEGAIYSLDLALQALQNYHKLFHTIVEMSRLLFPFALDNYPKHFLVGIYQKGLTSKGVSINPFTRVLAAMGNSEFLAYADLHSTLLELFTSSASTELVGTDTRLRITWGDSSHRRMAARTSYTKSHPTLNAMVTATGFDPYLDSFEVPDTEVDEFLNALSVREQSEPVPNNNADYSNFYYDDDYEGYNNGHAADDEGYLHSVYADNEQAEQLNALATLDAPCWVHFGHALFDDPKPCSRGSHCKHSHAHTDPTLAELYKARHRDMHLKMLRTRTHRSSENRAASHGGRQPAAIRGHHYFGRGPPHATRGPPSKGPL